MPSTYRYGSSPALLLNFVGVGVGVGAGPAPVLVPVQSPDQSLEEPYRQTPVRELQSAAMVNCMSPASLGGL